YYFVRGISGAAPRRRHHPSRNPSNSGLRPACFGFACCRAKSGNAESMSRSAQKPGEKCPIFTHCCRLISARYRMDRRRPRSCHLRSSVQGIKRERRLLSGLNNSRAVIEMLKPILTSATFAGVPALSSVTPAMAQGYGGAPGGSYLDTCREVRAYGDSLSA